MGSGEWGVGSGVNITNYQLPITNYRLPITNYQLPITNYQLPMTKIRFLPDNITIDAEVGEPLLEVAERAGIRIPTGCLMGYCNACQVELEDGNTICACITVVPEEQEELTINLYSDPTW